MSTEIERKFLLATPPDWAHPVLAAGQRIEFEQIYLDVSAGHEERIRRRSSDGLVTYQHAHLSRISPGIREIEEVEVDSAEYRRLRSLRDLRRRIVLKDRLAFHWHGLLFELDRIRHPISRACHLLEVQIERTEQEVILPTFLHIDREVTYEQDYSNAQIALG